MELFSLRNSVDFDLVSQDGLSQNLNRFIDIEKVSAKSFTRLFCFLWSKILEFSFFSRR